MDDQVCPRCKTTKYRNPSLKLMVNVCGHTLCESCVELLFLKGSGSCPECNVALRRSNFRVQLFEDSNVDKEVQIRKRILKDFNKKEDDFTSLDEYNDYLETIEELVFNLCNNIDIINTNKRIEQYKRDNRDVIMKNKSKLSKDELELEQIVEYEKEQFDQRRKELAMIEAENRKQKTKNKEELIDSLMASYEDANAIVDKFTQKAEQSQIQLPKPVAPPPVAKQTHFSSGIATGFQGQHGFLAVPKLEEGPLFTYESQGFETDGPAPPSLEEVIESGYISHIRSASDTSSVGNESVAMECASPDEGMCIDEATFLLDDSGEIRENELLLAEEDDNDATKDLDFGGPSPALFSLTSPKRARMMLEIQKSVERNGTTANLTTPGSSSILSGHHLQDKLVTPSRTSFVKPSVPDASQSVFRCIVNETPQQQEQRTTPWAIRSSAQSKQAGELKRQTISGAIDDLNEMTEELIDFIRSFEEKYGTTIN
uniref:CDK-activating kinase assembly factor MAT1 n=1 Tax=Anopheles funestus TaxID=62324 RepID=A0A182RHC3_ANOFN